MMKVRKANERGHFDHGWLDTNHTFSFGDYHDPDHMGFGALRVINEDYIAAADGFPTHPHRDMEIISYVVDGAIEHKDTMGNTTIIKPGEVQKMTAGTGIQHSEYNYCPDKKTHILQIWILPDKKDYTPSYGQMSIEASLKKDKIILAASKDGRKGSLSINQDADVYVAKFKSGEKYDFEMRSGRKGWIQIVKGLLKVGDIELAAGDGLAISDQSLLRMQANAAAEFLLFDLPPY